MGLDMFVYKTKEDIDNVDFDGWGSDKEEIFYWRKHPNLHGWFQKLYYNKGGKDLEFVGPVRITKEDLDELERDIEYHRLPHTTGFFFGVSKQTIQEDEQDLEFIEIAREELDSGYNLFYTSSW